MLKGLGSILSAGKKKKVVVEEKVKASERCSSAEFPFDLDHCEGTGGGGAMCNCCK